MTIHGDPALNDPTGGRPLVPGQGRRRGLGHREITLAPGLWERMQQTNAAATLRHCEEWMERTGWIANFDRVAEGTTSGERPGLVFSDSEVYKLMEALAWEHGRTGSPAAEAALRRLTATVARAQDEDGYLNTYFGHPGRPPRYSDLENGHELYCVGHLLQAAVARVRTTGPDDLVEVARRAADHVCEAFGPEGIQGLCGHPEIELGLMELGRALGERRYLDQAGLFLERRGHGTLDGTRVPLGSAYFQDDVPIRRAHALRGHAVRALYLTAAAVDAAVEDDDRALLETLQRQWAHTVQRRTYITGGMGARHEDEGFGDDWELPADRAYCESCAGIASVMVAWRLFLATGDAAHADLIERTFHNVVATSVSEDGRAFFYANPLHQRTPGRDPDPDALNLRAGTGVRAPWFVCSCCPTNIARTMATWHNYAATVGPEGLSLVQYTPAEITTELEDGRDLGIRVETRYPDDGEITVVVTHAPEGAVGLRLRVPAWAEGALLEVGGHTRAVDPGWAVVTREFTEGEHLRLSLPVNPRFTRPDARIDAVRGCAAVERGPLVYCAESLDLPDGLTLDDLRVDPSLAPSDHGGRVTVRAVPFPPPADPPAWPYRTGAEPAQGGTSVELPLTPYYRWAERGPAAMRVWLPITP